MNPYKMQQHNMENMKCFMEICSLFNAGLFPLTSQQKSHKSK